MTYRPEFSPFSVCVVLNGFYFCDGLALESKEEPKKKKKYSPTATCQASAHHPKPPGSRLSP